MPGYVHDMTLNSALVYDVTYVSFTFFFTFFHSQLGAGVSDHSIFSALSRHWEEQYHIDMTALNVGVCVCVCVSFVCCSIVSFTAVH